MSFIKTPHDKFRLFVFINSVLFIAAHIFMSGYITIMALGAVFSGCGSECVPMLWGFFFAPLYFYITIALIGSVIYCRNHSKVSFSKIYLVQMITPLAVYGTTFFAVMASTITDSANPVTQMFQNIVTHISYYLP